MITACIAKYKEDCSWINELPCKYIVYDKSKDIPNVGREAETYLRYIIENYDCLPEYVAFLQGHPFDHLKYTKADFLEILKQYNTGGFTEKFLPFNNILHEEFSKWTRTGESFLALFDIPLPETVDFPPGAQFIISKDCIRSRPLEFYKIIRDVMINKNEKSCSKNNCLVCPWTIERMWPYIFNPAVPIKQIKESDLL
jgi:hypothetical protein